MKQILICILLCLALFMGSACQKPTPSLDETPENSDPSSITPSKPYDWYPVTYPGRHSSGVLVNINETEHSAYTYEEIINGETSLSACISRGRVDEVVGACSIEYSGDPISSSDSDFNVKIGIGPTNGSFIATLEQKYNCKINSASITFTIDDVTYTILDQVDLSDLTMVLVMSIPIFDEIEGTLTHLYRHYRPIVGEIAVPLSLFDFSDRSCIEVEVNAILHTENGEIPESYAPCSFQLLKNENGYEFVGTDLDVSGFVALSRYD